MTSQIYDPHTGALAGEYAGEYTDPHSAGRMVALAEYVWGNQLEASRWMHTAHFELGGQTPYEASTTEAGTLRVEDLLNRVFYGMPESPRPSRPT